ncbi:hypothetical protein BH09BAC6_BH09BAC6_33630 [soil metagenome]
MIKGLLLFACCLLPTWLMAQNSLHAADTTRKYADTVNKRDLIDIFRPVLTGKPRPVDQDEKKKIYFSFLPLSSAIPGGGTALVTSTTAGFYLGDRKTTYLSSITFTPYFNLKGRYGLPIRSNIWLSDNTWTIQGDTRFLVYPQYTWGLGARRHESDKLLVNYNYIRFYQSALKRITSYFFAGIGYNLDYYIDIEPNNSNSLSDFTGYKFGTASDKNSFSSGPSINLLYDTRKNAINPFPGIYANAVYRYSAIPLGSNNNWQSLYLDFRKYVSLTPGGSKNELAFWTYLWKSLNPGTPYLDLPSIGMDPSQRSGRGIQQSRYRGQKLFYFESEYRRDITANGLFGFVIFANVNSVGEPKNHRFTYWKPAAGTGLRIKFNKKSDTNICIDYGFSRNYSALMFNLGEPF